MAFLVVKRRESCVLFDNSFKDTWIRGWEQGACRGPVSYASHCGFGTTPIIRFPLVSRRSLLVPGPMIHRSCVSGWMASTFVVAVPVVI